MKPLPYLALILAVTATAQPPAPKPPSLTDNSSVVSGVVVGFNVTDQHGCNFAAQWDAEKKVCAIHITFSPDMTPPITCSPVAKDSEGYQSITCWYTPKPAAQTPERTGK